MRPPIRGHKVLSSIFNYLKIYVNFTDLCDPQFSRELYGKFFPVPLKNYEVTLSVCIYWFAWFDVVDGRC
jgi:hypothetical protein